MDEWIFHYEGQKSTFGKLSETFVSFVNFV